MTSAQPVPPADPENEHLRTIFDLLGGVEDRWIRQMVPLAIGLLNFRRGLAEIDVSASYASDPIDSARHYWALSLGVTVNSAADIVRLADLAANEADEHLRAGYVEACALGTPGVPSERILELVGEAELRDPSPYVREAAYRAAGYLARSLGLKEENPWTGILGRGITDEQLGTRSVDIRTEIRRGAIEGIGIAFQGSANRTALRLLVPYLQDWRTYHLVAEAAFSVGMVALGTRDRDAMDLLRATLRHPEPHVRWNTGLAMGLIYFSSGDPSLLDDCELALADDDDAVRYYSSLGASLAFHGHAAGISPYYRLRPQRLEEYSRPDLALPNVDGLLIASIPGRTSYSGIGAHVQSYSSWYSLPFYAIGFKPGSALLDVCQGGAQLGLDYEDLLTLTVAHRFEYLRERGGVTIYKLIANAYRSLSETCAAGALADRHARLWESLDGFTRVHARSHVAELANGIDSFVGAVGSLPTLDIMSPAAEAFVRPVAAVAAGASEDEVTQIFESTRTAIDSSAFLGYRAALMDVLSIWETAVKAY